MKRYLGRLFGLSENPSLFYNFDLSPIVLDGLKRVLTLDQNNTIRRSLEISTLDHSIDSKNFSPKALPQQGDVREISLEGIELPP
jgi:hypothetical protein